MAAGRSPRMSHGAADLSSPTAAGYDEEFRFAAQQSDAPRLQLQMQDVHAWQQPLAGAAASDVRRATFTRSPEGYVGGSSADELGSAGVSLSSVGISGLAVRLHGGMGDDEEAAAPGAEVQSTQLAMGDFEIEEEEQPDGTQPADDHDMHEATQGANDQAEADCARFVLEAGPREAPASFEVPWEHGAKAELGRASGTTAGAQRIVLCLSAAQGVSRQHGWLRYNQQKGLEYTGCASSSLAVTFFNGAFLAPTAAPVILNNGDTLGFGGASQAAPGSATIVYKAVFINAPPLVPMPPPPPRAPPARPAPARPAAETGEPSAAGETSGAGGADGKRRGERGREGRKRQRLEAEDAPAAAAPALAVGALAARASLAEQHAALVQDLDSEQRKWAKRGLECAAECYGLMQDAVHEAAQEGGEDALHAAVARMMHKVQALAGDSARAQKRQRTETRSQQEQHARQDL